MSSSSIPYLIQDSYYDLEDHSFHTFSRYVQWLYLVSLKNCTPLNNYTLRFNTKMDNLVIIDVNLV